MTPGLKTWIASAHESWLAWQVELFGMYSLERLKDFDAYSRARSTFGVIVACLCAPVPCVFLFLLIDSAPLAPPDAGSSANSVNWVRNVLITYMFSYTSLIQLLSIVRSLSLGTARLHTVAAVTTAIAVSFEGLMANVIGFPLPFTMFWGCMPWVVVNVVMLRYYLGDALRVSAQTRIDTGNYLCMLLSQITMTSIYPAYIYGFTVIPPGAQKFYIMLLPILKVIFKNWFSYFMGELDDLKPEIVIFNVEIFNALYMSSSVQQSSSISATLVVVFVDWVQALSSYKDISKMHDDVESFMAQIPKDHKWYGKNFVEVALCVQDEDARVRTHSSLRQSCVSSGCALYTLALFKATEAAAVTPTPPSGSVNPQRQPCSDTASNREKKETLSTMRRNPNLSATIVPVTSASTTEPPAVGLTPTAGPPEGEFRAHDGRLHFVKTTAKLMFTSEFVVLLQYTEVVVPIIYSFTILIEYHFKNRPYYPQLAHIDSYQLSKRITSVMLYAMLELVAFAAMSFVLKRRLGIPTFKQLSFVLEKQWKLVQAKLLLWVFYIVQNSLEHFGTYSVELDQSCDLSDGPN